MVTMATEFTDKKRSGATGKSNNLVKAESDCKSPNHSAGKYEQTEAELYNLIRQNQTVRSPIHYPVKASDDLKKAIFLPYISGSS